jgi:hypothetical protein
MYWHEQAADGGIGGSLADFLRDEHGEHPKHPQILVAGSSLCIYGIHAGELEKRIGMPSAKISLLGGSPADALDILECFPNECQHANIIFFELAPERLKHEQAPVRREFFDKIRGTKNDTLTDFLRRSSMQYFIQICGKLCTNLFRSLHQPKGTYVHYDEICWNDQRYQTHKAKKHHASLQRHAEQVRDIRETSLPSHLPLVTRSPWNVYEKSQIEAVYRLLDLCRSRGIFVIGYITPQWYGQLNFTQKDIEQPTEDPYLALLQDLNKRLDCTVIVCRDFEEITHEGTDKDYLNDYGHMTRKGATVYTSWLADRLRETPKVAERFHKMPKMAEAVQDRNGVK